MVQTPIWPISISSVVFVAVSFVFVVLYFAFCAEET